MPALALLHGASINGHPVELIGKPLYCWPIVRHDGKNPVTVKYRRPDGREFDADPDWLLAVNGEAVEVLRRAREMERHGR